jgi:hypothetical protein
MPNTILRIVLFDGPGLNWFSRTMLIIPVTGCQKDQPQESTKSRRIDDEVVAERNVTTCVMSALLLSTLDHHN